MVGRIRDRAGSALVVLVLLASGSGLAHAGASRHALTRLCEDYWQGTLAAHPRFATSLGDRRYDARLEDISPAGIERERLRLEGVRASAGAIDTAGLSPAERGTRAALIRDVEDRLDLIACHDEDWHVDTFAGPQVTFMNLPEVAAIETPKQAADYVLRCREMGPYVDQHIANLERGIAARRYPPAVQVREVLRQLDALGKRPLEQWPLLTPLATPHERWSAAARSTFRRDLEAAVRDVVQPAMARYREFLSSRMLRVARSDERAGLSFLPGGVENYRRRVRVETSLDLTPEQLHRLGLEQVERVHRELRALGRQVFGTDDLAEIQRRLREDPALRFSTEAEVDARARGALGRARAALPRWFRLRPRTACEVRALPNAGPSVLGFYRPPVPGGGRPGSYLIATTFPAARRRYEAEPLAFHEGIPGHHVQVAIAQERSRLPAFRRHRRITAFVEGWALYAERLADEMGLYSSDLDRLGMLSYDAWRAARLVVDTGLNAMSWSLPEAADYLSENTLLTGTDVHEDLNRCLAWPGQMLAYTVGQHEILLLREQGRRRLGARFDIRDFHDAVLGNGAVPLPALRAQVETYYTRVEAGR